MTPTRRYLGRTLHEDLEPDGQGGFVIDETRYAHGDLIDSTQMQTDAAGAAVDLGGTGGGQGGGSQGGGGGGQGGGGQGGGQGGTAVSAVSYTAFGEYIGAAGIGDGSAHGNLGTRYQYAGGWGYACCVCTRTTARAAVIPAT